MKREKGIEIPYELFSAIFAYFERSEDRSPEAQVIRKGIDQKIDRIINREYYSKSKTHPDPKQRELYRQMYLDRIGVPESFRYHNKEDAKVNELPD